MLGKTKNEFPHTLHLSSMRTCDLGLYVFFFLSWLVFLVIALLLEKKFSFLILEIRMPFRVSDVAKNAFFRG
jgi:hypothetical protein